MYTDFITIFVYFTLRTLFSYFLHISFLHGKREKSTMLINLRGNIPSRDVNVKSRIFTSIYFFSVESFEISGPVYKAVVFLRCDFVSAIVVPDLSRYPSTSND